MSFKSQPGPPPRSAPKSAGLPAEGLGRASAARAGPDNLAATAAARVPHPQEISAAGFDQLPLSTREAMASVAGTSIAGLEEIIRTTHAEDDSRRDAHLHAAAFSRSNAVPDAKLESKPCAESESKPRAEESAEAVFGGVGDADPDLCTPAPEAGASLPKPKQKAILFRGVKHVVRILFSFRVALFQPRLLTLQFISNAAGARHKGRKSSDAAGTAQDAHPG